MIWGTYLALVAVFVVWVYFDLETLFVQIGVLLFTVAAMIIIMLHNNEYMRKLTLRQIRAQNESTDKQIEAILKSTSVQIEALNNATSEQIDAINETTEKQIHVFIEQCQGIISQLENMVGVLVTMSEQNAQRLAEEERNRAQEEEERRSQIMAREQEALEKLNERERLKPRLFVRINKESYFLFWTHYWIHIINTGAPSKYLNVKTSVYTASTGMGHQRDHKFSTIGRDQIQKYDIGNVDNFRGYDMVKVGLDVRNMNEVKYEGEVTFSKEEHEWQEIRLGEVGG